MKILLLEPFFFGSHKNWAEGYKHYSTNEIEILSLPGRHWKWRMHGGAISLAQKFMNTDFRPDLLLASDMLDLSTFMALTRSKIQQTPTAVYFHENQICYPWSPSDQDVNLGRNNHYGFINFTSALAANAVLFNSNYQLNAFLNNLPAFLQQFPDYRELESVEVIRKKSQLLYLGLSLKNLDPFKKIYTNEVPILLWNHRWEYDKNPEAFFKTLFRLKEEGVPFKLVVLGKDYEQKPAIFSEAKRILKEEILHFGYASNFYTYAHWLWKADILPVTSNQDFFGGSVVEAIYCNCLPILPFRLAYPEHIPKKHVDTFFYQIEDEFYEKLRYACLNYKEIKQKINFQLFVAHYDWSSLVQKYDQVFQELI